jgi:hypothetical protein
MPHKKLPALNYINYDVAGGKIRYSEDYVAKHTQLPQNPADIPHILGWSGLARSGTSALLFLLAGHAQIDRAYFQPQKTLLRKGNPNFELHAEDGLICMKEVFGSLYPEENYDPIRMLLDAGVPEDKITWIVLLRDPVQTFRSWHRRMPQVAPENLYDSQAHALNLFRRYQDTKVTLVPFVYELFDGQEVAALTALLDKVGLDASQVSLDFDLEAIERKLVKGQVADPGYFASNVQNILDLKRFVYSRNDYVPPKKLEAEVKRLCEADYREFCRSVQREFGDFSATPLDSEHAHNLELLLVNVTN